MRSLPLERKKYLLRQNQEFRSGQVAGPSKHGHQPSQSASYSPGTGAALIPRLVPQLTGDASFLRRFSITGWGTSADVEQPPSPHAPTSTTTTPKSTTYQQIHPPQSEEPALLQPQSTGSLWSSWWNSSGGEKPPTSQQKEVSNSAKSYIASIKSCKAPDMRLVKHLISLRVHLSTAKLAFIENFVVEEHGPQSLGSLLATVVGKSGKRKHLTEIETTVLLELIKCFRVLLNTEVRILPYLFLQLTRDRSASTKSSQHLMSLPTYPTPSTQCPSRSTPSLRSSSRPYVFSPRMKDTGSCWLHCPISGWNTRRTSASRRSFLRYGYPRWIFRLKAITRAGLGTRKRVCGRRGRRLWH